MVIFKKTPTIYIPSKIRKPEIFIYKDSSFHIFAMIYPIFFFMRLFHHLAAMASTFFVPSYKRLPSKEWALSK